MNKFQFGFRNMHSTFMALTTLLRNALGSGNYAVGNFLTFKKHSTLLMDSTGNAQLLWNAWYCSWLAL